MFRYFTKKSSIIIIFASLFLIIESFVGIVETDFISAMMNLAIYQGKTENLPLGIINGVPQSGSYTEAMDSNIAGLYSLGMTDISLILVAVLIVGTIFGALGIWFASKAISIYSANMRYKAYKNIQNFSFEDIDKFSPSSLVTRLTTDVEITYQSVAFASKFVAGGIFSIIFGIIKSSIQYSDYSITYAFAIPLIIVAMAIIIVFALPHMTKGQLNMDKINNQIRESVLGMRVVKAYNLESKQREKFEVPNESLANHWYRGFSLVQMLFPIIQCIITGLIICLYYYTYVKYDNTGDAKNIVGFTGILMQVLFGFIIIIFSTTQISRALPSIKRINEVTNFKPSLKYNNESTKKITEGKIEFKNLSHSFLNDDAHTVLKDINLVINPRERIGVIGGTGSGKSTLVNLLGRLFDPTHGEVLIDGTNVKEFSFNEINSNVAIAMQSATLFSGTIKSNIALGLPDNMEETKLEDEIIKASKASEAWEFISKKDGILEAEVEQRGRNFSGGQKQRISIARTIAKKSKIVIFDDSTSALDTVTERKVQKNIKEYNDATTIIVAQRISSVEELDKIIVMDDGKVVGFDSHFNLLADNETYRSIAASQLGTDDLNAILRERGLRQIEKSSN